MRLHIQTTLKEVLMKGRIVLEPVFCDLHKNRASHVNDTGLYPLEEKAEFIASNMC